MTGVAMATGSWSEERSLGSGTFGSVRCWRQARSGRRLALKLCGPLPLSLAKRWHSELHMISSINSDHVVAAVKIPDDLAQDLLPYNPSKIAVLCTEYCSGGNLRQLLSNVKNINGIPESELRCMLSDLKSAVTYLHTIKIVHKDLKPENIVLQPVSGDTDRKFHFKLTDLGHTKDVSINYVCDTCVGPLQYYSPELIKDKICSEKADYWSLGLIAFEAACGTFPFLPNITPSQRIVELCKKSPQHICVYESWDRLTMFEENIFKENRITKCLKTMLENWLRFTLEIDPTKRGIVHDNSKVAIKFPLSDDLITAIDNFTINSDIFTTLENILTKKIITIFSVPTYEMLSYEIDDSTIFSKLQSWIARDTKIQIEDQLFITNDACDVNIYGFVHKYYTTRSNVMLYLHQKGMVSHVNLQSIKPDISFKIQYCLEHPRSNLNHYHQHDTYASIYFLITNESCLYESLINGTIARIEYLKKDIEKLFNCKNVSEKSVCKMIEKSSLLADILINDEKKIKELRSNTDIDKLNLWMKKAEHLQDRVKRLLTARNQLSTRLESVMRRCKEVEEKDIFLNRNNSELNELIIAVEDYILSLRMIPQSDWKQLTPCIDAVKLIYKSLKIRDKLLHNIDNQKILQIILDVQIESEKMNKLISAVEQNADDLYVTITNVLIEKQNLMWELLENKDKSENNSLTNFKIGESVRCPKSLNSIESPSYAESKHKQLEFRSIIKEGAQLMKNSDDFIKSSHNFIRDEIQKSIMGIE